MNKIIFRQMYKNTYKVIFKVLIETKKMIDFIEKSKFKWPLACHLALFTRPLI